MSHTRSIALTIGLCTFGGGGALRADDQPAVTMTMEGVVSQGVTFNFAVVAAGQTSNYLPNMNPTISAGMTALAARNAIVPWYGQTGGDFEFERVSVNGLPGVRARCVGATNSKQPQFAIYTGGPEWLLVEPGTLVQFNGLTLRACIPDQCTTSGGAVAGGVPAVSTWGIAIMGLLVLTVGTVAILRRKRLVE